MTALQKQRTHLKKTDKGTQPLVRVIQLITCAVGAFPRGHPYHWLRSTVSTRRYSPRRVWWAVVAASLGYRSVLAVVY